MLAVLQMELQRLPGFRDFYPDDRAWVNYIFDTWRTTATNFGLRSTTGLFWSRPIFTEKKAATN